MINSQINRMAELALVRSIPHLIKGELKPSRLLTLYTKLKKEVDKDLRKLPQATDQDLAKVAEKITKFGKKTGWLNHDKHVITVLSYCLEMLETSEFNHNPKIIETLNKIIEHMEKVKALKPICCWAGEVAAKKWREL